MKGTKNKFLVKTTISTAWRLFDWLNFNEIDNAECHCVDLKQGQIFLDSFEYFFHNNMTINLLQAKDKSEYFLGHDEHPRPTCDRKYIPNKKDTVTYSFARHYFEGTGYHDSKAYDRFMRMFKEAGHINIGDSRNFPSSEHAIQILTDLADCSLFVGHSTSLARLAKVLDVPWVRVQDNGTRKSEERIPYTAMKTRWS